MPAIQQIKLFRGTDDALEDLEILVNTWLRDSGARVIQIVGNCSPQSMLYQAKTTRLAGAEPGTGRRYSPSDVMLAVLYEAQEPEPAP